MSQREFIRATVWRLLRDRGPLSARQVMDRLGIPLRHGKHPTQVASSALLKLCVRGQARIVHRGHHPMYDIVPGSKPPKDMRGKMWGSRIALRAHLRINAAKVQARLGRHPRPIPKTALEQAWGWMSDER